MKNLLLVLAFAMVAANSFAQTKISADSSKMHLGETVTICSKVYGVKALDKLTFINLGAPYPNSPLTVVIFAKDMTNFKDSPDKLYDDKQICVTGTVTDYKGKTQIVVTKPEEIEVKQ